MIITATGARALRLLVNAWWNVDICREEGRHTPTREARELWRTEDGGFNERNKCLVCGATLTRYIRPDFTSEAWRVTY